MFQPQQDKDHPGQATQPPPQPYPGIPAIPRTSHNHTSHRPVHIATRMAPINDHSRKRVFTTTPGSHFTPIKSPRREHTGSSSVGSSPFAITTPHPIPSERLGTPNVPENYSEYTQNHLRTLAKLEATREELLVAQRYQIASNKMITDQLNADLQHAENTVHTISRIIGAFMRHFIVP